MALSAFSDRIARHAITLRDLRRDLADTVTNGVRSGVLDDPRPRGKIRSMHPCAWQLPVETAREIAAYVVEISEAEAHLEELLDQAGDLDLAKASIIASKVSHETNKAKG